MRRETISNEFTGNMTPKEFAKYYKAAEHGDVEAQFKVGCCYNVGNGVAIDSDEAIKWLCKAAEAGHHAAQYKIGFYYYTGGHNGTAQNFTKAVKWLRKSAEQGNPQSQYMLGNCCYYGKGMVKDKTEAMKWWRKASLQYHNLAVARVIDEESN
jgi:TPR repeat protein